MVCKCVLYILSVKSTKPSSFRKMNEYSFLFQFYFVKNNYFTIYCLLSINSRGSDACRGSPTLDKNTTQIHKGSPPWNLWSAESQGQCQRQHRTEHIECTSRPRIEMQIPDPVRNRTRALY